MATAVRRKIGTFEGGYPDVLNAVARRVIWFGAPERAVEIPNYFLTYLMNYGTDVDLEVARKHESLLRYPVRCRYLIAPEGIAKMGRYESVLRQQR